jgi:hypothetical protein
MGAADCGANAEERQIHSRMNEKNHNLSFEQTEKFHSACGIFFAYKSDDQEQTRFHSL